MITFYDEHDLISFGDYLLSEDRKERFMQYRQNLEKNGDTHSLSLEESLAMVHHADVENWIYQKCTKDIG